MTLAAAGSLQPRGPVAETMADLWWLMLALGTAVFVLVAVLLWRGLRRPGTPDDEPSTTDAPERDTGAGLAPWLVGGGVVLPLVVIGVVLAATVVGMRATPTAADGDGLVIEVTGHQWWWEVHYPEAGVETANEIRIPVGEPVTFHLTSGDVIHSFWVPSLGGKLDAMPEDVNTLVLQADEAGEYGGDCAEFCGLQHARMGITVFAEPRADFDRWLADRAQPATQPTGQAAQRGQEVFRSADCARCHTIAGTTADGDEGPDLTHLASRQTLGAGVLENTPENLRAWISDPHEFKPGLDMPPFDDDLTDAQLADLVAYLQELQ